MIDTPGPSIENDTAAAIAVTPDTPWDILRAQLLWAIWCQRVEVAFREEQFHIGVVLWHAKRNTIYCAMEAYKKIFKHKRNEEKHREMVACFQQIWIASNIFGRLSWNNIKWNITLHQEFLLAALGAWNAPSIRIHRRSPTLDLEADLAPRPDFEQFVEEFIPDATNNWQPPTDSEEQRIQGPTPHARNQQPLMNNLRNTQELRRDEASGSCKEQNPTTDRLGTLQKSNRTSVPNTFGGIALTSR